MICQKLQLDLCIELEGRLLVQELLYADAKLIVDADTSAVDAYVTHTVTKLICIQVV